MQSVVVERFLGPTVASYYGKFSAHEADAIAHVRDFESRLLPPPVIVEASEPGRSE
jgi:hypothetical protein